MNKKLIRLTESDLHRIVKESVDSIIKETFGNMYSNNFVQSSQQARQQGQQQPQQQMQQQSFETKFPMSARQLQNPQNTMKIGKEIDTLGALAQRMKKIYMMQLKRGNGLIRGNSLGSYISAVQNTINYIQNELV